MRPLPDQVMLFATPEHGCSYLDGRRAVTLFVDPHCTKSPELYARLAALQFGFEEADAAEDTGAVETAQLRAASAGSS